MGHASSFLLRDTVPTLRSAEGDNPLSKPKSEKSEAACGGFFWVVRPTLRRRADEAAN